MKKVSCTTARIRPGPTSRSSGGHRVASGTQTSVLTQGFLPLSPLPPARSASSAHHPAPANSADQSCLRLQRRQQCLQVPRIESRLHHQATALVEPYLYRSSCCRLRAHAPGLTPRAVLEKLATIQIRDVSFPTTDGRRLVMPRYPSRTQNRHFCCIS
jgi:hypothetical protein